MTLREGVAWQLGVGGEIGQTPVPAGGGREGENGKRRASTRRWE